MVLLASYFQVSFGFTQVDCTSNKFALLRLSKGERIQGSYIISTAFDRFVAAKNAVGCQVVFCSCAIYTLAVRTAFKFCCQLR